MPDNEYEKDLEWAREHGLGVPPSSNGHHPEDDIPWGQMQEICPRDPIPELPPEMVPGVFRGWLTDIARQGCFPLEMVAAPAIVAASIVIGKKLGIKPWRFNDYIAVPNLWGAVNARPASLKSFAIGEAIKPLKRLGVQAHDRYESEKGAIQAEVESLKAEIDVIKADMKAAAKGKGSKDMESLKQELGVKIQGISSITDVERRYWVGDSTPEKLQDLMIDNPNGLLVSYDELAGWLAEMDRKGREGSRGLYLAAWEGRENHYVDRISRGSNYIPSVCLSVMGSIQPDRLNRYISEAMSGGQGGDGMIQRFQLLINIDHLHEWEAPTRWPDHEAKESAYQVFKWLDHPMLGSKAANDGGFIPYLQFSPEAQGPADEWREELEIRVRSTQYEKMPAFEAHLGKYRSLLPSLALIFHLLDLCGNSYEPDEEIPPISLAAFELAANWCDYLEIHAKRAYEAELVPGADAALMLAERIHSGNVINNTAIRELYRHQWSGLDSPEKVEQAVKTLESIGWVKVIARQTGGAPSRMLMLHPDLRKAEDNE